MDSLFAGPSGERLRKIIVWVVIMLGVFLTAAALVQLQSLRYIGAGVQPANTISVSGYGESFSVPDVATFTFSVVSEKTTVEAAQADATAKINAVTDYLATAGVEKKDIQTTDYNIYPQYDYQDSVCPASSPVSSDASASVSYCPPGRQVLRGYQVRQTTTIKVRDTAKAGELLAGVGSKGATEVSSLNFTFDDPQQMQDETRGKAIADAKEKADELAKQLGVRVVRVVSFSESVGGMAPMPYAKLEAQDARGGVANIAPQISVGQNKITSNVSVTYEIR